MGFYFWKGVNLQKDFNVCYRWNETEPFKQFVETKDFCLYFTYSFIV